MHFNEVAKYVILSPIRAPSDPQVFFVNKSAWDKLPDDIKVIVQEIISSYTQKQHEYLIAESIKALQKFKDAGCEVYRLPKEVEDAVAKAADEFYAEKSKKESPIFAEIYNSMKSFGEAYNSMK